MKRKIRKIGYLLLILALLPIVSGCNNEDDVIEIFTKNTWKLSRLTTEDSSARFLPNLWNNDKDYKASLDALNQESNFTINFAGTELNGEIMGTTLDGRGIKATFTGTWTVDGKENTLRIALKINGSETDPLAKEFIKGLQNVYKYEGDSNSLTLFFKDGQVTKVIGFTAQRK